MVRFAGIIVMLGGFLALSLFSSCVPASPDADVDTINLIDLQKVARQEVETGAIDLRSLKRYYYLNRGWAAPGHEHDSPEFSTAAVKQEVTLLYTVVKPDDRWLLFDLSLDGSLGTLPAQKVELFVGSRSIGSAEVAAAGGKDLEFYIPESVQKRGENFITIRFRDYRENPDYLKSEAAVRENPYPGYAGYLSNIRFVLGGKRKPWLQELHREEDVFAALADGAVLAQMPNSSISFGELITTGTTFQFAGTVKAPAQKKELLMIAIRARSTRKPLWRDLWTKELKTEAIKGSEDFQGSLNLDAYAGEPVELNCQVLAFHRPSNLRVLWKTLSLKRPRIAVPAAVAQEPARAPEGVRNVVIVVNDAWRADQNGFIGTEKDLTPNLDAFLKKGIVFRSAVTAASYTIASVATIFSGEEPETHGVSHGFEHTISKYPREKESLPWAFQRKGFFSLVMTGNPFVTEGYGLPYHSDQLYYLLNPADSHALISRMDKGRMEDAIRIAAASGKPVFIYAHFLPPHWPYNPPPPFDKKFIDLPKAEEIDQIRVRAMIPAGEMSPDDPAIKAHFQRYRNNVAYADEVNREFFDLLDKYGLLKDSMVIVTSDHGEEFGEKGFVEHSATTYEGAIHVPFGVWYAGVTPRVETQEIGLVDIFPTLCELFELQPQNVTFEGRSVAPLFLGREEKAGDYYFSIGSGHKLAFSMRGERYKYDFQLFHEALYDLQADPTEQVNIIDQHPGLATWLRQRGMLRLRPYRAIAAKVGEKVTLDKQTEEDLKNLGYLQ